MDLDLKTTPLPSYLIFFFETSSVYDFPHLYHGYPCINFLLLLLLPKVPEISFMGSNKTTRSGGDGTNDYSNCYLAPNVYFWWVQIGYGTDVVADPKWLHNQFQIIQQQFPLWLVVTHFTTPHPPRGWYPPIHTWQEYL